MVDETGDHLLPEALPHLLSAICYLLFGNELQASSRVISQSA